MDIRLLVRIARLTALAATVTRMIQVPLPAIEGYVHVGVAVSTNNT